MEERQIFIYVYIECNYNFGHTNALPLLNNKKGAAAEQNATYILTFPKMTQNRRGYGRGKNLDEICPPQRSDGKMWETQSKDSEMFLVTLYLKLFS